MPGFNSYQYQVTEGTAISPLNGSVVSLDNLLLRDTISVYLDSSN